MCLSDQVALDIFPAVRFYSAPFNPKTIRPDQIRIQPITVLTLRIGPAQVEIGYPILVLWCQIARRLPDVGHPFVS